MATIEHAIKLTDGRSLSVLEQGESNGRPIIYLHGSPGSFRDHSGYEKLYQQLGLRLISVNRPGTGTSSANADFTALSFADDLLQVFNQLSIDKATVIGFSAGGLYGCAFAHSHPQRVERLALLSSVGPFDNARLYETVNETTRAFYEGAKHNPEELLQQLSGLTSPEAMLTLMESIVSPVDKQLFASALIRENLLATFSDVLEQGLEGLVKEVFNIASPWGFSPAEIAVDTRLWNGTADQNTSTECSEYLAETIPSAKAIFVEGGGHYVSFEQWPELLQAITSN